MDELRLRLRRITLSVLFTVTTAVLTAAMARLLIANGVNFAKILMLIGFLLSLPWTVLGFWNATIGFWLTCFTQDGAAAVNPYAKLGRSDEPVTARIALAIFIRHEELAPVEARIAAVRASLMATGDGEKFDFFLLSDSARPELLRAEEEAVARLQARFPGRNWLAYRHRPANTGFKAGNMRDFLERWGDQYDFFIPLDADSLMSAAAILRISRIIQASPKLGILQTLVVGLPSRNFFTRLFQFGMRHGMRSYTTGSAWWQGDCGPFWGHNAIIRVQPFREHCDLPILPGTSPLAGHILSHDQVEAVLMRRAGYEVRVLVEEDGSFEENPPSMPDFIKRDLRWCQGNMQYWWLLGMPGLRLLSRVQLYLAILMYLSAPGWMLFILAGLAQLFLPQGNEPIPAELGVTLFATLVFMSFTPKLAGLADVIVHRQRRASYGNGRVVVSALVEFFFSSWLAPCMSLTETIFMGGLIFGKQVKWDAQNRGGAAVKWRDAARGLWPHTLLGGGVALLLAWRAPDVLPWAAPMIVAMGGAIPFAVLTSLPSWGAWATRIGLCSIPEEYETPPIVAEIQSAERPRLLAIGAEAQSAAD